MWQARVAPVTWEVYHSVFDLTGRTQPAQRRGLLANLPRPFRRSVRKAEKLIIFSKNNEETPCLTASQGSDPGRRHQEEDWKTFISGETPNWNTERWWKKTTKMMIYDIFWHIFWKYAVFTSVFNVEDCQVPNVRYMKKHFSGPTAVGAASLPSACRGGDPNGIGRMMQPRKDSLWLLLGHHPVILSHSALLILNEIFRWRREITTTVWHFARYGIVTSCAWGFVYKLFFSRDVVKDCFAIEAGKWDIHKSNPQKLDWKWFCRRLKKDGQKSWRCFVALTMVQQKISGDSPGEWRRYGFGNMRFLRILRKQRPGNVCGLAIRGGWEQWSIDTVDI